MQQQLLLNSKTTEQGIVQTASLFQEMIKAQEKRDLDPALLAIPTFSGEAKDRPQCLDWVLRVKNVCDQSGRSFRQELINKSGILVQNFIRSLNDGRQNGDIASKPPLRNRIKPAQELEVQQIMDNFNCEYDNVVEAVDLYNLDVEECTTA